MEIPTKGRERFCTSCRRKRPTASGQWGVYNGVKRWKCEDCAKRRSPRWFGGESKHVKAD